MCNLTSSINKCREITMKNFIFCFMAILSTQTGNAQSIDSNKSHVQSTLSGSGIGLLVGGPPGMIFGSFIGALLSENNTIKNSLSQKKHEYRSSIGSYKEEINKLNSALKEKKSSSFESQQIKHESQQISLVLLYRTNHYVIEPEYLKSLSTLLNLMKDKQDINVEILSFSDQRGTSAENLILSENRSSYLRDYLIKNGIRSEWINHKSFGETLSRSIDTDPAGLMFDRRIELTIHYIN